jgi:hypothetical protein
MELYSYNQKNARMDEPKTRREKKKDQKEKGQGKNGKYSSKHIRIVIENKNGAANKKQVGGN